MGPWNVSRGILEASDDEIRIGSPRHVAKRCKIRFCAAAGKISISSVSCPRRFRRVTGDNGRVRPLREFRPMTRDRLFLLPVAADGIF